MIEKEEFTEYVSGQIKIIEDRKRIEKEYKGEFVIEWPDDPRNFGFEYIETC